MIISGNPQPSVQPWDAHNQELAPNLHPAGRQNPTRAPHYNEVDQLLVAVGRAPNLEGLGREAAGGEFHKKGVKVNDRL